MAKFHFHIKTCLVFFFLLYLGLFFTQKSQATGFSIEPANIFINENILDKQKQTLNLESFSNTAQLFEIKILPFSSSPLNNGEVMYETKNTRTEDFIKNNIVIEYNHTPIKEISLKPYEKKQLNLTIKKSTTDQNDYYFSIIFTNRSQSYETKGTVLYINSSIGINIITSFSDKDFSIKSTFTNTKKNSLILENLYEEEFLISNSSQKYILAQAKTDIYDLFGRKLKVLISEKHFILGNSKRFFKIQLTLEDLLPGIYKTNYTFSNNHYGSKTKYTTISKYYAYFPKESIVILLLLGLLIALIGRHKSKT